MNLQDVYNLLIQLGLPSIIGVLIGGLMGYLPIKWQLSAQSKKDKLEIAEKIISSVYNFNIAVESNRVIAIFGKKDRPRQDFDLTPVTRMDEAIGLTKLYIGEETAQKLVSIKRTATELADIIVKVQPSEKRNLLEYKKFQKELDSIISDLIKWTQK